MKVCAIGGCSNQVRARGWCATHWARWRRTGHPLGSKPRRSQAVNLDGQRFGRLRVLARATSPGPEPKRAWWTCLCDCGQTTTVVSKHLRQGLTLSCGCLGAERSSQRMSKRWADPGWRSTMEATPVPCTYLGCPRPAVALGLCNAHYVRFHSGPRRRARRQRVPSLGFSVDDLQARLSMFAGCWMCGAEPEAVDHVKPLIEGGSHILANLRPACKSCNSRKGGKWGKDIRAFLAWCRAGALPSSLCRDTLNAIPITEIEHREKKEAA